MAGIKLIEVKQSIFEQNNYTADELRAYLKEKGVYMINLMASPGAGKTTTLRAVSGILDFEQGEIYIDGHNVKKEPVVCKSICAYIPDNPDIYDFLTGTQYLNYIADIFRLLVKLPAS